MRCYEFICPRCEFSARVCGQPANSRHCFASTIHCRECRDLYDIATHVRLRSTSALRKRLNPSGASLPISKTIQPSDMQALPPDHVWASSSIVDSNPILPEGLLTRHSAGRWVELERRCPSAPSHHIKPWTDPGRCPHCQVHLEKSLTPFRVTE